jgi:hypothetical protein
LRLQSRSSRENPWRAHFSCGVLLLLLLLLHWSSLKFNRFNSRLRSGAESTTAGSVFNKKKNKFSFADSLSKKLSESESKNNILITFLIHLHFLILHDSEDSHQLV